MEGLSTVRDLAIDPKTAYNGKNEVSHSVNVSYTVEMHCNQAVYSNHKHQTR